MNNGRIRTGEAIPARLIFQPLAKIRFPPAIRCSFRQSIVFMKSPRIVSFKGRFAFPFAFPSGNRDYFLFAQFFGISEHLTFHCSRCSQPWTLGDCSHSGCCENAEAGRRSSSSSSSSFSSSSSSLNRNYLTTMAPLGHFRGYLDLSGGFQWNSLHLRNSF